MSGERTPIHSPIQYAVNWMEQQAERGRERPSQIRLEIAARQQAAADAIRDMQAQLASVTAERDELLKDKARLEYLLHEAVTLLRAGKQQFTPHTTNSEVDDFIGRFDAAMRGDVPETNFGEI